MLRPSVSIPLLGSEWVEGPTSPLVLRELFPKELRRDIATVVRTVFAP